MNILIFIYSIILFTGGLFGYIKAHSPSSLIAGTVSCLLLNFFLFLTRKAPRFAYQAVIAILVLLDGFFTWRWMKTSSFMPAGALSIFTLAILLSFSYSLRNKKL